MKRFTDEHYRTIINRMLSHTGKTVDTVRNDPQWFSNNTMTQTQADEFKTWCIGYVRTELKWPVKRASDWFRWFWMDQGLRVEG